MTSPSKKNQSGIQEEDVKPLLAMVIMALLDTNFSDREDARVNSNIADAISNYLLLTSSKSSESAEPSNQERRSDRVIIIRAILLLIVYLVPTISFHIVFSVLKRLYRIAFNSFTKFFWFFVLGILITWGLFHVLITYPERGIPPSLSEQDRTELITGKRENAFRVVQSIAGLGFLATAIIAWKNYQISEDKNVSERFIKAVEMLADERMQVRIGGIHSLERIARDSREDHPAVMDVLIAFIREQSQSQADSKTSFLCDFLDQGNASNSVKTNNDIRSAILVVDQRNRKWDKKKFEADLRHACLDGLDLSDLDLKRFNFSYASLRNVNLRESHLDYANFNWAKLDGANLSRARASHASFMYASMKRVKLDVWSTLFEADLQYADLEGARLAHANLSQSQLKFARFNKANLRKTNLKKAKLEHTIFDEANLENAVFTEATGLTEEDEERLKERGAIFRDTPQKQTDDKT